jgi:long-chain fatty acid transport protein
MAFGTELLLADIDLLANIGGGQFKSSGEPGVAIIPSIGWVHHLEGTPMTIGLGVYGIGGFRNLQGLNATTTNLGLTTPLFADADIFQLAPTVSFAVSDRLAVGIAPTITAMRVMLDPLGPSVVNPGASAGTGNRVHWGGGVQIGLYYMTDHDWNFGLTIKSPQWIEEFRFYDDTGGVTKFDLDLPMILSLGASYTGKENWLFAVDVRYFDYDNTDGFSEFGWSNVFAAALGAQYSVNECWDVRFGYNFNQNPISPGDVVTNLSTPLIQDQNVTMGFSYHLTDNVDLSLAYVYLVTNSVTGPLPSPPFGPTDTLTHEITAHSLIFGVSVGY